MVNATKMISQQSPQKRKRLHINGRVQGVGFRPCVYRIAIALQCTGFVFNHSSGVTVEIQGEGVDQFVEKLRKDLPPLAVIDEIVLEDIEPKKNEVGFSIIQSQKSEKVATCISPDICICNDCLQELFDPKSRFFHYPFLNCTNCGPRLTIIQSLPYDRSQTSMRTFPLCESCQKDYSDPLNRRYHAQPTACPACGPKLSMPIDEIVSKIQAGEIVAVKGLGGYQLICDAHNKNAVHRLRQRKQRDAKPFALMTLNVSSLDSFAETSPEAEELLQDRSRPIVLLPKKVFSRHPHEAALRHPHEAALRHPHEAALRHPRESGDPETTATQLLAPDIAQGLSSFGVMLPSTPLHYLLFHGLLDRPKGDLWFAEKQDVVLVVTSANLSGQPLLIDDQKAEKELENIADAIVSYNRDILTRVDDSVVNVVNRKPLFVRRARGYVPNAIKLARSLPPGLAVGGLLKNTFCVVRGNEAYVSQYIGDLENAETIQFFQESLEHLLKLLDVKPEYIAHDWHPDFYSTQWAQAQGVPAIGVQHHHAHCAAVMAEHHLQEPVLGLSLDGYGYGEQGESWGGELFLLEGARYQRLGHLKTLAQPGGDIAAREPWRMAVSVLHQLGKQEAIQQRFHTFQSLSSVLQILDREIHSPRTSSCGRLFDAASALLGVQTVSAYEGQAAMCLESLVLTPVVDRAGWRITENNELDLTPLFLKLLPMNQKEGAACFHGTLSAALADWVSCASQETGIKTVVMSGGCFLNKVLTEDLTRLLIQKNIRTFLPNQLPPSDGSISLGQIWMSGIEL